MHETSLHTIDQVMEDALTFLHDHRSNDGLWRDFKTLAGESSEWVTGFTTYAICISKGFFSSGILPVQKLLMLRQRKNGGWAFNRQVPTDADSTAWVLLCLGADTIWRPSVRMRAINFLKSHQNKDSGGFSTYSPWDGIHRYIGTEYPALLSGWYSAHVCVSGVVMQSLLLNGVSRHEKVIQDCVKFLLSKQESNGLWKSYWWTGHAYSTFNALRALAQAHALPKTEIIRTQRALLDQQLPDGGWSNGQNESESDLFSTGFNIRSLLLHRTDEGRQAIKKAVRFILNSQESDGSWKSALNLRIPSPKVEAPELSEKWRYDQLGTEVIIHDEKRIFTTAAVLSALAVYRSMERVRENKKDRLR